MGEDISISSNLLDTNPTTYLQTHTYTPLHPLATAPGLSALPPQIARPLEAQVVVCFTGAQPTPGGSVRPGSGAPYLNSYAACTRGREVQAQLMGCGDTSLAPRNWASQSQRPMTRLNPHTIPNCEEMPHTD